MEPHVELLRALYCLGAGPEPVPSGGQLQKWHVSRLDAYFPSDHLPPQSVKANSTEQLRILKRPACAVCIPNMIGPFKREARLEGDQLRDSLCIASPSVEDLVEYMCMGASTFMNGHGGTVYWGLERQSQCFRVVGLPPPNDSTLQEVASHLKRSMWPPVERNQHYSYSFHAVEGDREGLVVVAFTFQPRLGLTSYGPPMFIRSGEHKVLDIKEWVKQIQDDDEDDEDPKEGEGPQSKSEDEQESEGTLQQVVKVEKKEDEPAPSPPPPAVPGAGSIDPLAQAVVTLLAGQPGKQWITQEIRRSLHRLGHKFFKPDLNRTLHKSGLFVGRKNDQGDTEWQLKQKA